MHLIVAASVRKHGSAAAPVVRSPRLDEVRCDKCGGACRRETVAVGHDVPSLRCSLCGRRRAVPPELL